MRGRGCQGTSAPKTHSPTELDGASYFTAWSSLGTLGYQVALVSVQATAWPGLSMPREGIVAGLEEPMDMSPCPHTPTSALSCLPQSLEHPFPDSHSVPT